MNLLELAEHVVDRVGVDDDTTKGLAKRFIKRRYKSAFDKYPWLEAHATLQLRATVSDVILPDWADKVLQVRADNAEAAHRLQMVSRQTVMLIAPGAPDELGAKVAYSPLPSVAVHTHPLGNRVTVESSNGGDADQSIRIRGMHNGLTCEETIQLAGMTPLTSANYYNEITHFSKPETLGNVTLKSVASTTPELQVLLAAERERRHIRIQLIRDFADGDPEEVVTVLVKRRCIELRHDNDTPQIDNLDDSLIAFAMADMLERERQFAKAQAKVSEGVALLNEMVIAERDQRQNIVSIIPDLAEYAEQSLLY